MIDISDAVKISIRESGYSQLCRHCQIKSILSTVQSLDLDDQRLEKFNINDFLNVLKQSFRLAGF